jgi:hypothetical protein
MESDNGNNGNGGMLGVLERMLAEQQQTNSRLDQTNAELKEFRVETTARLDQTNASLGSLRTDVNLRLDGTNNRIDAVNDRLDNVIRIVGTHHADHEQRLRALEDSVFKKSG